MRSFVVRVVAVLAMVLSPVASSPVSAGAVPLGSSVPAELTYACALKSNGLMRVVASLSECGGKETALTIKPGPVLLCIQPSGSTRYVTTFKSCRRPALQITLPPAAGTVFFCAAAGTGVLRYATDPSQCSATEQPVQATPSDDAPRVLSTVPAEGATNISTTAEVTFTMSEAVTLAADAVDLTCAGQDRTVTTTVAGLVVRATPVAPLPEGATCTATLLGARLFDADVIDPPDTMAADVRVQFTVDSPPSLASSAPADGGSDVALDADVVLTFSEPVTVPAAALSLVCAATPVPVTVSGSGTATVTVDPDDPLPATASCGLEVTGSMVTDVDTGDPPDAMTGDARIAFTTVDEAPSVTATTPPAGATDVGPVAPLSVTFSEPVSVTPDAFVLSCAGSGLPVTVSAGPATTFAVTPAGPLPKGVTCILTVVAEQVSDVDSVDPPDHPSADTTVSFTTSENSAPTAVDLAPRAVAENSPVGTAVGSFTTTDADSGDTFTYTLVSGIGDTDNSLFAVNGTSLKTAGVLDADASATRTIRVRSTDAAGAFVEGAFEITVTDVSEAPSAPQLTGQSVEENQPAGTQVGTLSATDPDAGQTLSFAVVTDGCGGTYDDGTAFTVSGTSLQTATELNYEVKSSYDVCVQVTDSGSPALSTDASFTITVNDVNDPPTAGDDDYSGAVGNTMFALGRAATPAPRVAVTGSVLTNDSDEDGDAVSAVPETVVSAGGGTASIFADGSFTFLPGVGDKGLVDTFTYHVSDGEGTAQGTVSVTIGTVLVWWVDSAAPPGGDGRSTLPLSTLTTLDGNPATDPDAAGDTIFLRTGVGAYAGGLGLEASQSLVGDRAGLTIGGVELAPAVATAPVLTNSSGNGLDLANGVSVQGVDVSGASGDGIHGAAVTTAAVGTSSPVGVSSSGGDGLELSGAAAGQIFVGGSITGSGSRSVVVSGRSGGAVAVSATVTGKGVELSSNTSAAVSFTGALALTTTTTPAFSATGGGTVSVATAPANTLASTTGEALVVENTTIGAAGMTFRSVSANGAVNGIRLTSTGSVGSLQVAGGGSTSQGGDASGGTIQATSGPGILLTDTTAPSFNNVSVLNVPTAAGVRGSGVNGFSFTNGRIDGSGLSGSSAASANIAFNTVASGVSNLVGAVAVSNSVLENAYGSGLDVYNEAGTISALTVSSNLVQSGTSTGSSKGHGVIVQALGSSSTAAAVTSGGISGNAVRGFPSGGGILLYGGNVAGAAAPAATFGTSDAHVSVSGNTVRGASDGVPMNTNCVYLGLAGRGSGFIDVVNNGTPTTPMGANRGTCISVNSTGAPTLTSTVSGNVVAPGAGQNSGAFGIAGGAAAQVVVGPSTLTSAVLDVRVLNNSVSGVKGTGVSFVARDSATMRARIQNNSVAAPTESGGGEPGIQISSGDPSGGDATVCLLITGNVSAGSLSQALGQVAPGIGLRKQGNVAAVNDFGISGLTSSPTTAGPAAAYVASVNPGSSAGGAAYGGLGAFVLSGDNFLPCALAP
ncbi:MAG: Ig-like domain-containing protein [Ornithinibacter sp.]